MAMHSKKIFLLFGAFLLAFMHLSSAQVSFKATISPGEIGKNENAELRLMVDNARQVDQIIPPSLKDFIIVSGPNQETGMESNNGVTRQYIGITYVLKPRSAGKYIIEAATAKADGKTLRSNRLSLVVNNSTGNSQAANALLPGLSGFYEPVMPSIYKDYIIKKGENIKEKIRKNIFIKLDIDKRTCFIGEPVTVVYKLYTRLKSESNIVKNPSFNGFSVIDLLAPGNTYYSIEKLNGREYNVYTLRKSQLYPLQAGKVELESAEVENNIHFIKQEYVNSQEDALDNMFRDFTQTSIPAEGLQDEKVTLQSKAAFITVKPLPEKDQPASFKGAVGNFTIDGALEKNNFTTDDAGKLNITISGQGNMPMIISPEITWPQGIESYESHAREDLDQTKVPVSGTKIFEYPFTVAKAGNYTIPEITFSFFDVKDGKYKTVKTKPFLIEVAKGSGKNPIKTESEMANGSESKFSETIFSNRWLIIIPLAILMLAGLFVWFQKDRKSKPAIALVIDKETAPIEDMAKKTNHLSVNPLLSTEEKMSQKDSSGFYLTLNGELKKFLSDKLLIPLSTINKKRIAEEADRRGISVDTSLQIQQLLDDIEWQLYTPFASEDKMEDLYNKADEIIHVFNATVQ